MKEFRLLYLIGDIQDKFILEAAQEQQDTRRGGFSKKFRYCALGLCAAMALCAGFVVYTQFQRTSDSLVDLPKVTTAVTDDDVQIANPFQECTDLSEAAQIAGFSITAPDSCVNSSGKVIQAIQNDMIEIIYQDDAGNELARIRKGLSTSEISGDYNLYENDSTQEIDGKSVHIRGNGRLVYAADWTDGVYAYSVTFESGAAEETAEDVIMAVY
ncbi:hypothetical protein [Ruminococcus sp.]